MPTNLAIDDKLLNACKKIGGHKTKRETVNEALQEYLRRRKRMKLLDLVGKIDFRPGWDPRKLRGCR